MAEATRSLAAMLANGAISPEGAAGLVVEDNAVPPELLQGLDCSEPRGRYGCAKALRLAAQQNPTALYPYLSQVSAHLDGKNNIPKWTAIDILGSLALVDRDHRVDNMVPKLCGFLAAGSLITANHAIGTLAAIASTRIDLRPRITQAFLGTERFTYETPQCRNIAIGKVILAFGLYMDRTNVGSNVAAFVQRQVSNPRPATRNKAMAFLKRIGAPSQLP